MIKIDMLHSKDPITLRWSRRLLARARFIRSYVIDSAPSALERVRRAMIVVGG